MYRRFADRREPEHADGQSGDAQRDRKAPVESLSSFHLDPLLLRSQNLISSNVTTIQLSLTQVA